LETPPDIKAILAQLSASDEVLKGIIQTIPTPVVESTHDVFHDLMSCIFEQQIHYRSTKRIFAKMLERASLTRLTLENFAQIEEKALPHVKLATAKYETLAQTLDFFKSNKLDWQKLSDAEVRAQLSTIKGIGAWTMDMILMYTLQRPGVVPFDDFHLKEIMVKAYGLNPNVQLKKQMQELAAQWQPHQSLAVHYLLAWKAFKKGGEK
jgi:DNA-3-methyladenine glycosylase II